MAGATPVGKGNVSSISHDGNQTLTVVFNGGRTYEYTPVTPFFYNGMIEASKEEGSEGFKQKLNEIKSDSNITYKEIKL